MCCSFDAIRFIDVGRGIFLEDLGPDMGLIVGACFLIGYGGAWSYLANAGMAP